MSQEQNELEEQQDDKGIKVMLILYPRQIAALDAYAKRLDRSRSSTVRQLIDRIPEQEQAQP